MSAEKSPLLLRKHDVASTLLLAISLMIFLPKSSYSFQQREHIEFEKFTPENGLASSKVWAVIQDYKGLIWIGSEGGLNQYDGYNFKLYEHDNLNPNSLGYNHVTFLFEDKENRLWICTRGGGLNLYNREKDNFYSFKFIEGDSNSISGNYIHSIFQDSGGTFWVVTNENGICTFKYTRHDDPNDIKFKRHLSIDNVLYPSKSMLGSTITEDQNKNIWIGTANQGIFILHNDSTVSKLQHDPHDENSLSSNNIFYLFYDSKSRIWVATRDAGVDLYNPKSKSFIHYSSTKNPTSISNNQVKGIAESGNGEIWIGTDTGLDRFEDASKQIPDNKFRHYTHNPNDDKSLKSDIIESIYFDYQDRLWVSTMYGGVNIWDKAKRKFHAIRHEKGNSESISGNNITTFAEDAQGNIWIGTDGEGINVYNKSRGSIYDNQFIKYLHDAQNPNSLAGDKILSLSIDSKGGIWIGKWATGLDYLNPKTNTFTHFLNNLKDNNSISSDDIFTVAVDKRDNVWIGTFNTGLNYYNTRTKTFTRYLHDANDSNSIGSNMISALLVDDDNNLWIGTDEGGLNYFDWEKETFKRYTNPDKIDFRQFVVCLYRDSGGTLWASFYGHGILYMDENEDKLINEDIFNASNLFVNGILDDGENLWVSTNNVLISYNQNTKKSLYFDAKDGLQGGQFVSPSAFKTSDGTLLFGGNNGFNAIDPRNINFNTEPPPIIFTDITINDQAVKIDSESPLKQHISETDNITLKYKHNSISISFAALNYTMPDKNQYSYILEGFHDDWISLQNERKVVFTNLDPDTYTLRVKASNNDGVWNEQGISLTIEILPPWWATIWFRFILVVASIAGAFSILKLRTRYLERQRVELRRIITKRTEEISDINTELNERIKEISLQNSVLSDQKNEIHAQNNQLAAFNEELTAQNEQVSAQNEKIQEQNKSLEEFQMQITGINKNLEQKVKSRTKKLKKTIDELNKTVIELDRFVYSASHDLSSPLKSILGLVNLANIENEKDKINEYLSYIESSIHKLEGVIKNLIQFSKNKKIKLKTEKIKLNSLVEEVIKELRFMPKEKNMLIENDIQPDYHVVSDYQRLKVVLHNLISNAIKYSDSEKPNKKIIITNQSNENEWELTISDNGIGIDKDNLNRIFNMFFRATEKSTGSGLGLFIVKETVEKLEGRINVTSKPDIGSSFTLTFKN